MFVPFTALQQFADEVLGWLTSDVAIISGQTHHLYLALDGAIALILDHPRVVRWFCQNLPLYAGGNGRHPKVSPFPYGMAEAGRWGPDRRPTALHLVWHSSPTCAHQQRSATCALGSLRLCAVDTHNTMHPHHHN